MYYINRLTLTIYICHKSRPCPVYVIFYGSNQPNDDGDDNINIDGDILGIIYMDDIDEYIYIYGGVGGSSQSLKYFMANEKI